MSSTSAAINYDELARLFTSGKNEGRTICPLCSHRRSTKENRNAKVLKLWRRSGFISYACGHCLEKGYVVDPRMERMPRSETARIKAEAEQERRKTAEQWKRIGARRLIRHVRSCRTIWQPGAC
jgi:hypothetical protein